MATAFAWVFRHVLVPPADMLGEVSIPWNALLAYSVMDSTEKSEIEDGSKEMAQWLRLLRRPHSSSSTTSTTP